MSESLPLIAAHSADLASMFESKGFREIIVKLANLSSFELSDEEKEGISFIAGKENFTLLIASSLDAEKVKKAQTGAKLSKRIVFASVQKNSKMNAL